MIVKNPRWYGHRYTRVLNVNRAYAPLHRNVVKSHYRLSGNERCVVCLISTPWYAMNLDLPHYCHKCAAKLNALYRGKYWDDEADIPF